MMGNDDRRLPTLLSRERLTKTLASLFLPDAVDPSAKFARIIALTDH